MADVDGWVRVSIHSLYTWKKKYEKPTAPHQADTDLTAELRHVEFESRRVTEELCQAARVN